MITATEAAWINLGCGKFPLEGYVNVDAHEDCADLVADVWDLSFRDVGCVRMDHFLEHFGWRETVPLLEAVRGWMQLGGVLEVEVPDMEAIMAGGTQGDWLRYVYGSQQHEGEHHRTGFTVISLFDAIEDAGYNRIRVERIVSDFSTRAGMPCLKATARA